MIIEQHVLPFQQKSFLLNKYLYQSNYNIFNFIRFSLARNYYKKFIFLKKDNGYYKLLEVDNKLVNDFEKTLFNFLKIAKEKKAKIHIIYLPSRLRFDTRFLDFKNKFSKNHNQIENIIKKFNINFISVVKDIDLLHKNNDSFTDYHGNHYNNNA